MAEFEKREMFPTYKNTRYKRSFTAYKLLVDPALQNGSSKVYRFDGSIPDDPLSPPVILSDPRGPDGKARLIAKAQYKTLTYPIPLLKIDKNFIGRPPPVEVSIKNLNVNITKTYLESQLTESGEIVEVHIFCHPVTKKSLGFARVVFKSIASARRCVKELDKTSIMDQVVDVFLDPFGRKCEQLYNSLTAKPRTIPTDEEMMLPIDNHYQTKSYLKSSMLVDEDRNSLSSKSHFRNELPDYNPSNYLHHENISKRNSTVYRQQNQSCRSSYQSDLYSTHNSRKPDTYLPSPCVSYAYHCDIEQNSSYCSHKVKNLDSKNNSSLKMMDVYGDGDYPKMDLDTRIKLLTENKLFNDFARLLNDVGLGENEEVVTDAYTLTEIDTPLSTLCLTSENPTSTQESCQVEEIVDAEPEYSHTFRNTFVPVEEEYRKLDNKNASPPPSPFITRLDNELDAISDESLEDFQSSPQKLVDKGSREIEAYLPEDVSMIPLPGQSPPPLPPPEITVLPPLPDDPPPPESYFPNYSHIPNHQYPYGEFRKYFNVSTNHIPGSQYMYPPWDLEDDSQPDDFQPQPPLPLDLLEDLEKPPPPPEPVPEDILQKEPLPTPTVENNSQTTTAAAMTLAEFKTKIKKRIIKKRLRMGRVFLKLLALKSKIRQMAKDEKEAGKKVVEKKRDKSPLKISSEPPVVVRDEYGRARLVYKNNFNVKSLPKIPKHAPTLRIQIPKELPKRVQTLSSQAKFETDTDSDSDDSLKSEIDTRKTCDMREQRRTKFSYTSSSSLESDSLASSSSDASETETAEESPADCSLSEGEIVSSSPEEVIAKSNDVTSFGVETSLSKIKEDSSLPGSSQSQAASTDLTKEAEVLKVEPKRKTSDDGEKIETNKENKDIVSSALADNFVPSTSVAKNRRLVTQEKAPIKPKPMSKVRKGGKTFPRRSEEAEKENLYDFLRNGIDEEDLKYTQMAFEGMLKDGIFDNPQYYWPRERDWVAYPATYNPRRKPDPRKRIHHTGSARTEGFYKMSAEEKEKDKRQWDSGSKSVNNSRPLAIAPVIVAKDRSQGSLSREVRSHQRRLQTQIGNDVDSELLKFNQLKYRKKKLKFGRSKIHEWGLFASQPIAADEMVIEYVGEKIRTLLTDIREKQYEAAGSDSSYMFRVDGETFIDASTQGNISRFINHSCNPNCYAKVITIEDEKKIVIYSKQPIAINEEITYNYKFPYEERKIPCSCGSANCRGTLN